MGEGLLYSKSSGGLITMGEGLLYDIGINCRFDNRKLRLPATRKRSE